MCESPLQTLIVYNTHVKGGCPGELTCLPPVGPRNSQNRLQAHTAASLSGEVYYRSKYLRSDTYNANIEANRIVVSEFGTMAYPDPCKNIFSK